MRAHVALCRACLCHRLRRAADAENLTLGILKKAIHRATGAKSSDVNALKLRGYLRKAAATHLAFSGAKNPDTNWFLHSTGSANREARQNANTARRGTRSFPSFLRAPLGRVNVRWSVFSRCWHDFGSAWGCGVVGMFRGWFCCATPTLPHTLP